MIRRSTLLVAAGAIVALAAFVLALLPPGEAPRLFPNDKAEHMLAFFSITALLRMGAWRHRWWPLYLAVSGFGALIELAQALPIFQRDASLFDLLADMVAAGLAMLAAWPIVAWRRRTA